MDLVLEFERRKVLKAVDRAAATATTPRRPSEPRVIGETSDGYPVVVLPASARTTADYGSRPVQGNDVVIVKRP